ncbi:MAG: endonuclease/exonuclease/phosphatase family protein [Pseudomonadota bacterium]
MIVRLAALICALWAGSALGQEIRKMTLDRAEGSVRIATFNASLNRRNPGELVQDLRLGKKAKTVDQIDAVAEIIQLVRPDIILINELDSDPDGIAATLFRDRLATGTNDAEGIAYPHVFTAPSNTGIASGHDLDGDGRQSGPKDAFGFGYFEGQYGMAILSRFPIDESAVRTFQRLLWADMPGNLIPPDFYKPEAAAALRLSSKSHWDVPVTLPGGRQLHLLASHPTPPVFDGPEDANGRRNHDEIRFWADYIQGQDWVIDDAGTRGGLASDAAFAVLGDLNADPSDGAALRGALLSLLGLVQDTRPTSPGATAAAGEGANTRHRGNAAEDTADWRDIPGPGNLRVDYVLPSRGLNVSGSGVFWPAPDDPLARLVTGKKPVSSDHRLVWVDIR